jgi:putative transcriptional regulator
MAVLLKLKEVRQQRGVSQNELAQLTEMSPQNIQKLEQYPGKFGAKSITFETLDRLCRALSCKPGDLLDYVEDDPSTA